MLIAESFNLSSAVQPGGNMFGLNKNDDQEENKNKIEQLEDKVEELENKIANIYDVLEIQEDEEFDDSIDEDSDDEDSEE
jgi:TolA-binding protein